MKTISLSYFACCTFRKQFLRGMLGCFCFFSSSLTATAQYLTQEVAAHDTIIQSTENAVADSSEVVLEELTYEGEDGVTLPSFPGGMGKLSQFLASKLRYPIACMENGIQGTVHVKFLVTSKGEVKQAKVDRSVDNLLDAEALRVVKLMPLWIPGEKNGKPVSVWFQLPIVFRLG